MESGTAGKGSKVDVKPDDHLTYLIAKVEHQLTLRLDRALRSSGLTLTQFSALANIGANPGMSSGALARALLTTPQAVATLVRRLSAAGMIEQDQQGRGLPGALRLTDEGSVRLLAAAQIARDAERENLASLSSEQQAQIFAHLSRLHDALNS